VRASINLGSATEEFGASLSNSEWTTATKGGLSKWKEKRAGTPTFAVDK